MKIGLDIMSGDKGPLSNIKGAIRYIKNQLSKDNVIFLYGNENIFKNILIKRQQVSKHKISESYTVVTDLSKQFT